MIRIVVDPLQRLGVLVVFPDVAHEFLVEILDVGEDPSRDHVALDAGEPVLDLVEPGRVGGRVVHRHVGVLGEEVRHGLSLVAADVVADDVDGGLAVLGAGNFSQEGHELSAGVTRGGSAEHLACGGVECGEQTERAVALVLEAVTLGASGGQRQHAVLAVDAR